MAISEQKINLVKQLPKVELHAHLNGSIRRSTLQELLDRERHRLPSHLQRSRLENFGEDGDALKEIFLLFDLIHHLTSDLDTTRRITREMVEDFAQLGCVYLEIRTTPRKTENMSKEDYVRTVLDAARSAAEEFDVVVNVILSINRTESSEEAMETAKLAVKYRNRGVCGMDSSGNPTKGSVAQGKEGFDLARAAGLPGTFHFAEVKNHEESRFILENMEPQRLGHACHLSDDVKEKMLASPVLMEVCLTSNVVGLCTPSYEEHHVREFFGAGYPISICTDDVAVFRSDLCDELNLFVKICNPSAEAMYEMQLKAMDWAFGSEGDKEKTRQRMRTWRASAETQKLFESWD